MIIEIKDIPGKKIKHISFDIEFDDGDTQDSIVISDQHEIKKIKDHKVENHEVEDHKVEKSDEIPEVNIDNREKKEIPSEMQDLEF